MLLYILLTYFTKNICEMPLSFRYRMYYSVEALTLFIPASKYSHILFSGKHLTPVNLSLEAVGRNKSRRHRCTWPPSLGRKKSAFSLEIKSKTNFTQFSDSNQGTAKGHMCSRLERRNIYVVRRWRQEVSIKPSPVCSYTQLSPFVTSSLGTLPSFPFRCRPKTKTLVCLSCLFQIQQHYWKITDKI